MFHRIRILNYLFEDYTKKYPLSKTKINDCVDWIYEYIKTCEYINKQTANQTMLEKETKHKELIENELLKFAIKHKLFEIKEGCGRRRKYTLEEVRRVIGKNWFSEYFSSVLKLLTYSLTNKYKEKIRDKYKIYLINQKYEIKASEIEDNEKLNFILYDL